MPFDKSTQNVAMQGGPLVYPVVHRAGFLGTSMTKLWENTTNMPARVFVNLASVVSNTDRTVSLAVVEAGDTPTNGDENSVGTNLPFDAYESIEAPAVQEFYIPGGCELWGMASHASSFTCYICALLYQ